MVDEFRCVAAGSISQDNPVFGYSRNSQCICMATTACVYVKYFCSNRGVYSSQDIDYILIDGDTYYKQTKMILGPDHEHGYLNVDEVGPVLVVQERFFSVATQYFASGYYPRNENELDSSIELLSTELGQAFDEFPDSGFIFIGLDRAIAIWVENSHYFIFDSHSVGHDGQYISKNVARIFSFTMLKHLAKFIMKKSLVCNGTWQYEISQVIPRID